MSVSLYMFGYYKSHVTGDRIEDMVDLDLQLRSRRTSNARSNFRIDSRCCRLRLVRARSTSRFLYQVSI